MFNDDQFYDPTDPEKVKRFQEQNQRLAIFTTLAIMLACTLVGACTRRGDQHLDPITMEAVTPPDTLVDVDQTAKPPTQQKRRGIPLKPEPFQKTTNCNPDTGEELINGACYAAMKRKPPCGPILLEHNGTCYRAVAKPERKPTSIEP